ncbi:potassium channel family protein [Xanthobacter autotrophicus DSM 431]|uniref:ion channel n=1 Tax=Xanthobacter nonsaccharivorans TaxID=3119912 RepID=UPI00372BDC71
MDEGASSGTYLVLLSVCVVLAMLTVMVHAIALSIIRRRLSRRIRGKDYDDHVFREAVIISTTVLSLSLAHLLEMQIWGVAYAGLHAIPNLPDALYYSMSTYTTVGADGVFINPTFRVVAGFESLIGPMMVAWSTAFLVEFVVRMRGQAG